MQGWTPLHVAVTPKTHIKGIIDWSWTKMYQDERKNEFDSYDPVHRSASRIGLFVS